MTLLAMGHLDRADVERRPAWVTGLTCLRAGLLLGWVLMLLTAYVVGEHRASLSELYNGVANGDVHEVTIEGGLAPGADGSTSQFVRWRDGHIMHFADLVVSRGDEPGLPSSVSASGERTTDDVAAEVAMRSDDVTVVVLDPATTGGATSRARESLLGWGVPEGFSAVALVLGLLTLIYLALGPEPWRASRWAWFWLISSPLGAIVFLLLSGPLWGLRRPSPTSRRLKGWGGLLLGLFLSAVVPAWSLGSSDQAAPLF